MQKFYRNSESTANTSRQSYIEPRICFDDDCSFPFGPACSECRFAFDLHQIRKAEKRSREGITGWIDEEVPTEMETNIDLSQNRLIGNNSKEDIRPSDSPHLTNASKHRSGEISDEDDNPNLSTPNTTKHESFESNEESTNRSSASSSSPASVHDQPLPNSVDDWLSELFSKTLQGQLNGASFIGGATDENSTLDFCPFCSKSLGDPRDQHLLRCKYAHEEQERMEEFIARAEKRTRR